jgi:hypothetical protein
MRYDHWLHKAPHDSGGVVLIQPLRPAKPCETKHLTA